MAYPSTPFTLHGGCGCQAIRYRVNVPSLSDRQTCPYAEKGPGPTMPFTVVDHCNDCRQHTGSLVNYWLLQHPSWVEWSFDSNAMRKASGIEKGVQYTDAADIEAEEKARIWLPDADIHSQSALRESRSPFPYLSFYQSSADQSTRTFCNRCGTSLTYHSHRLDWPGMDIQMGTLDREDLEKFGGALRPEKQAWGKVGVDWVKKMTMGRTKMDLVPGYFLDEAPEMTSKI